jgi:hypothetical protein
MFVELDLPSLAFFGFESLGRELRRPRALFFVFGRRSVVSGRLRLVPSRLRLGLRPALLVRTRNESQSGAEKIAGPGAPFDDYAPLAQSGRKQLVVADILAAPPSPFLPLPINVL